MRLIAALAPLMLVTCCLAAEVVNPLITIPRVSLAPTIDGVLSPGEWSSAARIPYFVTVRGEIPDQPTTAYVCYTDRALLVAFECREDMMPQLKAKVINHDEVVWSDDSVELFIQPGSSLPYYHIAANSLGTTYDAVNPRIMESDKTWEPGLKVAASKGDSAWFVEIAIPIADLGVKSVRPGDSWRMNLCRERKAFAENSSWSPLRAGEATFADPERFGTIVFGDANTPLVDLDEFVVAPNGVVRQSGRVRNPSGNAVSLLLDTSVLEDGRPAPRSLTVPAAGESKLDSEMTTEREGGLRAVLEARSAGKLVYRAVRPAVIPPMRSRLAELTSRLKSLEEQCAKLPAGRARKVSEGLSYQREMLAAVAEEVDDLHSASPRDVGRLSDHLDQVESALLSYRLSIQLAEQGAQDVADHTDYYAWATDPWIQLKPNHYPPFGLTLGRISAAAYRGERVYLAVNVSNLSERSMDFRVVPGPFSARGDKSIPAGQIDLHACAFVPEDAGSTKLIGDALPLADGAGRLTVPARQVGQAFIVVRTGGLEAGEYSGLIRVSPTTGGPSQQISARIRIYPLDLPNEPKPWICTWGGLLNIGWTKPNQRAYFEDALDRGVNIFFMNPASVAPKLDRDGGFPPIDYTSLDRQFSDHKGCTRAVGAYNVSIQFTDWAKKAGIEYMSPAYREAFIAWMRDWIEHVKSLGYSYDDFAFELVDEPATEEKLRMHIDTGKLLREADPEARIVTTTNFAELDKLRRIEPYVDIWVPQGKVLEDAAAREFMKRTGKEMWMYVCEGDSKRQCPVMYYRILPWQAFRYDLQGWGFFAHMWYGEQPWEAVSVGGKYLATYSTVYPGVKGPVTSRRWECYFKGHEDFRALNLLKSLVARGEQAGLDVTDAREILGQALDGSARLREMKSTAEGSAHLEDLRLKVADISVKLSRALGDTK